MHSFHASLHEYPQGPSVTSSPISFTDSNQKEIWISYFPKVNFWKHFTYSEPFAEKYKDNTRNRISLFQQPAENWVGVPEDKISWTYAAWHAFGIAWIKTPNAKSGKDLVVYDVEGYFPHEVKKWEISSMPLIRGYVKYCSLPSKRKINKIWVWQDKQHRGNGECLKHTLPAHVTMCFDIKIKVLKELWA